MSRLLNLFIVLSVLMNMALSVAAQTEFGGTDPCEKEGIQWSDQCGIGVGECEKGHRTCVRTDKGLFWTPCEGGIGPNPDGEIPGNELDDDCNGLIDEGGMNLFSTILMGTGAAFIVIALIMAKMG